MKPLKIPATLVVTLAANLVSCTTSNPVQDAATDARDVVSDSSTNCDHDAGEFNPRPICARPTDGGFGLYERCSELACDDSCPAGCRRCLALPFGEGVGLNCRRTAGSMANCPETVCSEGECPMGCQTCISTLFCIADTIPDGGAIPTCDNPRTVCDPTACGPGCRAVG